MCPLRADSCAWYHSTCAMVPLCREVPIAVPSMKPTKLFKQLRFVCTVAAKQISRLKTALIFERNFLQKTVQDPDQKRRKDSRRCKMHFESKALAPQPFRLVECPFCGLVSAIMTESMSCLPKRCSAIQYSVYKNILYCKVWIQILMFIFWVHVKSRR